MVKFLRHVTGLVVRVACTVDVANDGAVESRDVLSEAVDVDSQLIQARFRAQVGASASGAAPPIVAANDELTGRVARVSLPRAGVGVGSIILAIKSPVMAVAEFVRYVAMMRVFC